jgi:hypothetical protein
MKPHAPSPLPVDDLPLRLAYASGDMRAYSLAAIRLGVSYTDDLMITHRGEEAVGYWRVFGDLLPWEK